MRHRKRGRSSATLVRLLAPGLLLATLPTAASAASYYVSPAGSDSYPGTSTYPFRQIRKALTVVKAGDTIYVRDGDYLGFNVYGKNGTETAPITIQALGSGARVLPTTDRSDNRDTIFVSDSSHVVLDGLRSFGANRAAIRLSFSHFITIRRGVYGNNAKWGIFTNNSNDTLIEHTECYGSVAEHGIYISNSSQRPTIRGNVLHDNAGCGLHMNADVSMGLPGITYGALIEGNVIFNNGTSGGAAINLDGVQDSTVRNNLLFNNHATGIAAFKISGAAGPRGLGIYHNTVHQASDGRWSLLISASTGINTLRNNILLHGGTYRGGLLYVGSTDVTNTDSDYNVIDRISPNNGATIYSLSQWKASGHEPHSVTAAASTLFENPGIGDYHLLAGCAAVNAGLTLNGVDSDLEGNPRPADGRSDIGAYERPAPVASLNLSLSAPTVNSGYALTGTVVLGAPAPAGGVVVALSDDSASASVPAAVTVPQGLSQVSFTVSTAPVTADTAVTVRATIPSASASSRFTILAPQVLSISLSATSVVGGKSVVATVRMTGKVAVSTRILLGDNSVYAAVPPNVFISAGGTQASFTVTTKLPPVSTVATIWAAYNNLLVTAPLTIKPY